MGKINQGEYEKMKRAKSDGYEWVAKDMSGGVFAYKTKPEKYSYSWIDDNNYRIISSRGSELEVLRWGDEEPYSIVELIEGYERESEEEEVNKQKLIEKWELAIESAEFYGKGKEEELIGYMKDFVSDLNQLEEPEALSDDWLDDQPMNITQHRTITLELTDLYARKNQDYGNSFDKSLDEDGLLVLKIRLGDKYKRFSTLINQKNEVVDESMRDTLIDLANYALMGVMWMDNQEED